MSQRRDHPRAAESRGRGSGRAPGGDRVLREAPTSPRENPPTDEARVLLTREDYARVLGS